MKRSALLAAGLVLILSALGCAKRPSYQTIRIPPAIDLNPHQMIGVIEFDTNVKGDLGPLVTRRFTEMARRDQGLLRMMDLGPGRKVLRSTGRKRWNPASLQAVGAEKNLQSLFVGELDISKVQPRIGLSSDLSSGHVSGEVTASLSVQLVEAATGASIWSRSATATTRVGQISVLGGGDFSFEAADADKAYGALADLLVEQVTREFRATYTRQRI